MNDKNIRITDKHVFFWFGWPSNWYPSKFTAKINDNDYQFYNVEQYFMYMKAIYFNDVNIANEIIEKGSDPKEAKRLGRLVSNYDDKKWGKVREDIMFDGNYLKYNQNKDLFEKLMDETISDKHFVEGSPYDKIWGIGVNFKIASDDESTWKGKNLLGKVLDKVRDSLK